MHTRPLHTGLKPFYIAPDLLCPLLSVLPACPGKAISADYTYMIGCTNDLAVRHIPDIPLRKDTLAGPYDRHCDMVRDTGIGNDAGDKRGARAHLPACITTN